MFPVSAPFFLCTTTCLEVVVAVTDVLVDSVELVEDREVDVEVPVVELLVLLLVVPVTLLEVDDADVVDVCVVVAVVLVVEVRVTDVVDIVELLDVNEVDVNEVDDSVSQQTFRQHDRSHPLLSHAQPPLSDCWLRCSAGGSRTSGDRRGCRSCAAGARGA